MARGARMLLLVGVLPLVLLLFLVYRSGFLSPWQEVQSADAHFRARFPVPPQASSKTVAAGRKRSTTWNFLKAREAAVEYVIGWGSYPPDLKLVATPQVFQNMEAAVAQECGGKLAEERALHRPLRGGMLEGRYLKIDAGQGWAEGYLFLLEGPPARVWQVRISYPKAGPAPPVQKFLNGFQVLDL